MKKSYRLSFTLSISLLFLFSCSCEKEDILNQSFPEAEAELEKIVYSIIEDAETANLEGLTSIHLDSDKFTKYGPRSYDRQDVKSTNESEAAFFGSISNFNMEIKELKIDVFGEVAVVTHLRDVSFLEDGLERKGAGRQTFVFLRTEKGWKIVHEHGTNQF